MQRTVLQGLACVPITNPKKCRGLPYYRKTDVQYYFINIEKNLDYDNKITPDESEDIIENKYKVVFCIGLYQVSNTAENYYNFKKYQFM